MKTSLKAKIVIFITAFAFLFFFSNDFGLIDVEKTSIITAVAIDKTLDKYEVTAQIAVPEATDTNSENLKAQLSGKGYTVGEALKDLGDVSGWFPKLSFCNLILLGNSLSQTNVIEALDYFAKTLRVQDSALVALSSGSAKELLEVSTPLDNISAFALQKIMLKNQGFDRDVAKSDIKTFCAGHYSRTSSAYMPIVKMISSQVGQKKEDAGSSSNSSNNTSSGGQSSSNKGNVLFDAKTTALFKDGYKVGELSPDLTFIFNAFNENFNASTIPLENVKDDNGNTSNYLLTVINHSKSIKLKMEEVPTLYIKLSIYGKISDHAVDGSKDAISQNIPIPLNVKNFAENKLTQNIYEMVSVSQRTNCDFLNIKEKLYRHHNKQYNKYKDDILSVMKVKVDVSVSGQK